MKASYNSAAVLQVFSLLVSISILSLVLHQTTSSYLRDDLRPRHATVLRPVAPPAPEAPVETATTRRTADSRCAFPLVYNKPMKTGSTFIQTEITRWAKRTNRSNYICGVRWSETAIRLPECVPHDDDGCGIVNCHLHLSPPIVSLLQDRLPGFRLLTSTRHPPLRIVSEFMQLGKRHVGESKNLTAELSGFLTNVYSPTAMHGYHFGVLESLRCPLSVVQEARIFNMVAQYDIVIDANLLDVSNTILRHHNLFQLRPTTRLNERGSARVPLNAQLKQLLRDVSCYEHTLHAALQLRMASLYEEATGRPCVVRGRLNKFTSCLADMEKEVLADEWFF